MLKACQNKNIDEMIRFSKLGADINYKGLLSTLVSNNYVEGVAFLVNHPDFLLSNSFILVKASSLANLEIFKLIHGKCFSLEIDYNMCFYNAAISGRFDIVRYIYDKVTMEHKFMIMIDTMIEFNDMEGIKSINLNDDKPFFFAIKHNNLTALKYFLDKGLSPDDAQSVLGTYGLTIDALKLYFAFKPNLDNSFIYYGISHEIRELVERYIDSPSKTSLSLRKELKITFPAPNIFALLIFIADDYLEVGVNNNA